MRASREHSVKSELDKRDQIDPYKDMTKFKIKMDKNVLTKVSSTSNIFKYGGPSSRTNSRGLVSAAQITR